jgi:hypothetical protein
VRPHETSEAEPIHPQRVVQALRAVMPDDGIVLPDVGVHHNWVVQFWRARRPQTLLNSWGFGAMGFGVCGVLGAKLAAPDRPCVTVCGDGGFMMRPDVLCTAVEYDIPAVWVIWNNFAYGGIRDLQLGMFAKREIATSFVHEKDGRLVNPDFVALARACGADGIRVERPGDLAGALEHAIKADAPFVWTCTDRDIRRRAWAREPPPALREPAFAAPGRADRRYPRPLGRPLGPGAQNRIPMAPMEKNLALPTGAVSGRYVDTARRAGAASSCSSRCTSTRPEEPPLPARHPRRRSVPANGSSRPATAMAPSSGRSCSSRGARPPRRSPGPSRWPRRRCRAPP